MTPKQQDERSRVEVTDAMVEAYLKAQRQHMEDLENKWPGKSLHKDDISAACHAGLTATLSAHLEARGDVAKDERDTWTAGDCYKETYADHFEAGIDHHGEPRNVSTDGTWGHRIVCYGATEREAIDLRDKVLAAITTDAEAKP